MNKRLQSFLWVFVGILLLSGLGHEVNAQSIIAWEVTGAAGNETTANSISSVAGVSTGVLSRGAGLMATAAGSSFNSNNWYLSSLATTIDQAINNNKYLQFTVPITAGTVSINEIKLALQASNTGPGTVQLRSSIDNFASSLGTAAVPTSAALRSFTFVSPLTSQSSTTISFRLYGYSTPASSTATPGTGGTVRIANFTGNDIDVLGTIMTSTGSTLTATPNVLGLSYVAGTGPASGTVSLSGSSLTPVSETITATSSSTAFVISPASTSYASSSLAATSFSVSLVAGLSAGTYSGTITFAGGGATATVPVTGTVTVANPPVIVISPASLNGFTATQGTVSTAQTYTLTGSNLTAGIAVSAPSGFEVSQNGTTYASSLTVAQTAGVASATISGRLSSGAAAGTVSGSITHTSTGAAAQNVAVSGTVSSTGSANVTGNVVISQVYGGGGNTGATYKYDFIELFNRGNTPVDITGWSVQYASSTGTFNQVTNLSGVIQRGGYYLIQEAAGTGGTTDLPDPDASGSIAMSGTNGKIILVNTTTPLNTSCTTGNPAVIDLVGYGSANCFEGSGATAALTNTTAALRANNGCTDTNSNSADFTTTAPVPRNSASPAFLCNPTGPYLAVSPDPLVLTYTENSGPASRTISVRGLNLSPESGNITVSSSNTALQLSYNGSSFTNSVTIPYSSSALASTVVTAQLVSGLAPGSYPVSVSFVGGSAVYVLPVTGLVNSSALGGVTPIATARTLPANTTVTIQGRVTVSSQFGGRLFYIQDNTGGIAVYSGASPAIPVGITANIGDLVTVNGPISVYNGYVEINGVSAYTITPGTPANAPAPVLTTLDQLGNVQGKLVRVADVAIGGTGATFTGNTNYPVTVGGSSGVLRINSSSDLASASKPATATVIGIAERFVSGATTIGTDNIQLQPRILTDVSGASAVAATDQFCGTAPATGTLTQDQTFDFATFNVEFFGAPAGTITCTNGNLNYQNQGPSNEILQAQNVNKVLSAINADVFVLEEVSDQTLLQNNLPAGYALSCSSRFSYYFQDQCTQTPTNGYVFGPTSLAQKVCVAYKTSTVTSVSATPLLSDYYGYPSGTATSAPNNWSSGRLPYLFVADATINGVSRRLHIIGIHAKSGSATSDYNRRKQDVLDLYNLLTNSSTQPGPLGTQFPKANILIAGDFNDFVTRSIATGQNSTYRPFVDDAANFSVLTKTLEQNGCNSFFGNAGSSFLDHIVVSNELVNAYVPGSVGIQTSFSGISGDFTGTTSDHRPVFARFDLSQIPASFGASVATSTSVVCPGTPVTLSLTVQGVDAGQTYSYTVSNGTNSTTAAGISVSAVTVALTPTVAGAFTLTVQTSNSLNTSATSRSVSISTVPAGVSLTSGTVTCAQPIVTLTAVTTNGSSFTLNGSRISPTGQFTVNTPGTYTVVAANAAGCVASATATVISNTATPANTSLTSGTLTCTQQSLVLTASSTGGTSYVLSNGQSSSTGQFVVTTSGVYTVTAIASNGCSATATGTVTAEDSYTFATTPIQTSVAGNVSSGASVTITAQLSGASNYSLTGPNGFSATSAAGSFTVNQTGLFTVTVQNNTGCLVSTTIGVQPSTPPLVPGTFVPTNMLTCPQPGQTATAGLGAVATGTGFTFTGPAGYVFTNVYRQPGTYNIFADGITTPGSYTLTITNQGLVVGVYTADITSDCTSGRVSQPVLKAGINGPELKVTLSGNPTADEYVTVTIEGATGQSLRLQVDDANGIVLDQKQVVSAGSMEQQRLRFGMQKGSVYLKITTPAGQKTIWIAR